MHSMPANTGYRIVECSQNVGNRTEIGMLVQQFEAAATDDWTPVG